MGPSAPRTRNTTSAPPVVDLAQARDARRLRDLMSRCRAVDDVNRKSLGRLFQTNMIFTRQGARLGRDLLLAHQHLLRVTDLLSRIADLPETSHDADAGSLYDEAQMLLARTAELTARSGLVLARGS